MKALPGFVELGVLSAVAVVAAGLVAAGQIGDRGLFLIILATIVSAMLFGAARSGILEEVEAPQPVEEQSPTL